MVLLETGTGLAYAGLVCVCAIKQTQGGSGQIRPDTTCWRPTCYFSFPSTRVLARFICKASISCYFEPFTPTLTQCPGAIGSPHRCQGHEAGHEITKKAAQTTGCQTHVGSTQYSKACFDGRCFSTNCKIRKYACARDDAAVDLWRGIRCQWCQALPALQTIGRAASRAPTLGGDAAWLCAGRTSTGSEYPNEPLGAGRTLHGALSGTGPTIQSAKLLELVRHARRPCTARS